MTATPQILLRHADAIADLSEPTAAEIAARKEECERLVNDRVESSVDAALSVPPASVDEGWRLLALKEVTMSGDKLYLYPTGWEAVSDYGFVVDKHTVPICRRLNLPAELTRLRKELDVAEQRCRRQEALVWGIHAALGGDDRECGDDVKALAIEVTAELKAAKAECERLQKKAVDTAYAEREAGAARANSMDAEIRRFIMERDELRQRIAALDAERDKIQSDYRDYVNGENEAVTKHVGELEADRKLDSDALAAAEVTIATLEATAAEAIGLLARSRAHIGNMLTVLKDEIDAFLASHPSASAAEPPIPQDDLLPQRAGQSQTEIPCRYCGSVGHWDKAERYCGCKNGASDDPRVRRDAVKVTTKEVTKHVMELEAAAKKARTRIESRLAILNSVSRLTDYGRGEKNGLKMALEFLTDHPAASAADKPRTDQNSYLNPMSDCDCEAHQKARDAAGIERLAMPFDSPAASDASSEGKTNSPLATQSVSDKPTARTDDVAGWIDVPECASHDWYEGVLNAFRLRVEKIEADVRKLKTKGK